MNWILKIAPKELRLIDIYLRENYPWIWATRIHFTLYAMILLGAFAAFIGLITPVDIQDPLSSNDIMTFFGIFMFPTIIFMGYIIFQLCLFSVEKRKGKSSFFRPLIVFPLMMISVLTPTVMPFTVSYVLNTKTGNVIDNEQVDFDRHNLKKAEYFINDGESDYIYFDTEKEYKNYWNGSTSQHDQSYRRDIRGDIYDHVGRFSESRPRLYRSRVYSRDYNNSYYRYSTEELSSIEMEKSVLQFYHDQNLNLSLTEAERYLDYVNDCIERYSQNGKLEVDSILYELKHNIYSDCYSNRKYNYTNRYNDYQVVRRSFHKASRNLSHIKRAQSTLFPRDAGFMFLGFLWATFIITLLLFIFRLVHWKQFLLSILIIGIYLTLIGIIEGVGNFHGDFFPIMAVLFVIASMISLNGVWGLNKFSAVINQMAIITFLSLPFFPVMILAYLDEVLKIFTIDYFDKYLIEDVSRYRPYSEEYYELKKTIWLVTFWSGLVFFYLIGLPYLKKVFLRLMSLPKKN